MFTVKEHEVEVKVNEMNFKQRMYQNKSIVTVQMMVDFYPTLIDESIISGGVDIKLDIEELKSIHELENKNYKGKVGFVSISINNHGVWEYLNLEEFEVSFGSIHGNKIEVAFRCQEVSFDLEMTMCSLYTTSSDEETLKRVFDLKDFYSEPVKSIINKRTISKYYLYNKVS